MPLLCDGVVAHGGARLHVARRTGVAGFGGGLGDQGFEHPEVESGAAHRLLAEGVHVVGEVAGEDRREVYPCLLYTSRCV